MAFLLLGIISLSIGLANFACASEPRNFDSKLPSGLPARKAAETSTWAKFKATLWDIKSVVTVPTFAIIIVQVRASLRASALTQCELANTLSCYYVHLHIVSVKACCRS